MEYKEIIKLLDAGFSKDEILQMETADPEQKDPEQKDPEQNDPEQKDPEQTDNENALAEIMTQLKGAVEDMKKEFTAMNIMNSRQEDDKTGEDIIANIINPPKYNKKEGK